MAFEIIREDITRMAVDAIVNPTNSRLHASGGVDAAIHRAAGSGMDTACRKIGTLQPGAAAVTPGFDLPCRYVIHTVGPRWYDGAHRERETLQSCYRESLHQAAALGCRSVALPLIASGSFGFPKDQALFIAVETIRQFLTEWDMTVYLVVFDKTAFRLSAALHRDIQAYIDENYVQAHTMFRNQRNQFDEDLMPCECAAPMPEPPMAAPKFAEKAKPTQSRRKAPKASLSDLVKQLDESFTQMLLRKIDESGMSDSECYKRAHIDRKLFSKIRSDVHYRPKKNTALAFAIALKLNLEDTRELLEKAGFALSHSNIADVIVEYFIQEGIYDLYQINEALFSYDQALIGA